MEDKIWDARPGHGGMVSNEVGNEVGKKGKIYKRKNIVSLEKIMSFEIIKFFEKKIVEIWNSKIH